MHCYILVEAGRSLRELHWVDELVGPTGQVVGKVALQEMPKVVDHKVQIHEERHTHQTYLVLQILIRSEGQVVRENQPP